MLPRSRLVPHWAPSTAATLPNSTRSPCSWYSCLPSACREWSSRCCRASRVRWGSCGWCSSPCSARRCWSPGWPTAERRPQAAIPGGALAVQRLAVGDHPVRRPGAHSRAGRRIRDANLTSPEPGWAAETGWYLFNTLIFGALSLNLWEETAWAGFAQSRWMDRHGRLVASLITAVFLPPFTCRCSLKATQAGPGSSPALGWCS